MRLHTWLAILLLLALTGCVVIQEPIPLSPTFYQNTHKTVGILKIEPPKASVSFSGSLGVLEYLIVEGINSNLNDFLSKIIFPEYNNGINSIADDLKTAGFNTVMIKKPISREALSNLKDPSNGNSSNDFSHYQKRHQLDYLLIINIASVGTEQGYYSVIPITPLNAQSRVSGQMIDLTTNKFIWYDAELTATKEVAPLNQSNQTNQNSMTQTIENQAKSNDTEPEDNSADKKTHYDNVAQGIHDVVKESLNIAQHALHAPTIVDAAISAKPIIKEMPKEHAQPMPLPAKPSAPSSPATPRRETTPQKKTMTQLETAMADLKSRHDKGELSSAEYESAKEVILLSPP